MTGSIKSVPGKNGVWEIRYDSEDATGHRVQHKKRIHGSKREAKEYLARIQAQKISGQYTGNLGDTKVRDYLNKWEQEYCKNNLAYKTHKSYASVIRNYIKPELGGIKLSNLRPAHIQAYYAKLSTEKNLSNTSVLYHHRILHEALKHGSTWDVNANVKVYHFGGF